MEYCGGGSKGQVKQKRQELPKKLLNKKIHHKSGNVNRDKYERRK